MVKASIGLSKIHGFGLIARQSIKAGTLISKYQEGFDRLIPRKEYDALPESAREYLEVYSYWDHNINDSLVLMFPGDDDRFTNHSDTPNTRRDHYTLTAAVDINKGDEITCNYFEVERPRDEHSQNP